MNRKSEQTILFFISLFAVVLLISTVVKYILDPASVNVMILILYGCGILCIVYSWIQLIRNKKKDEE